MWSNLTAMHHSWRMQKSHLKYQQIRKGKKQHSNTSAAAIIDYVKQFFYQPATLLPEFFLNLRIGIFPSFIHLNIHISLNVRIYFFEWTEQIESGSANTHATAGL